MSKNQQFLWKTYHGPSGNGILIQASEDKFMEIMKKYVTKNYEWNEDDLDLNLDKITKLKAFVDYLYDHVEISVNKYKLKPDSIVGELS